MGIIQTHGGKKTNPFLNGNQANPLWELHKSIVGVNENQTDHCGNEWELYRPTVGIKQTHSGMNGNQANPLREWMGITQTHCGNEWESYRP